MKFPILRHYYPTDLTRDIYLVNCQVDSSSLGFHLVPIISTINVHPNLYQSVLTKLISSSTSGFPTSSAIKFYEQTTSSRFRHSTSGINGVKTISPNTLAINLYDSVKAFGGGSALTNCLRLSINLTLMQFPDVHRTILCLDRYPTSRNQNCAADLQP